MKEGNTGLCFLFIVVKGEGNGELQRVYTQQVPFHPR